ncbi:hypothetical protein LAV84_20950 [Rhizobium sp. VS19-DR104.2]|uniref:AbiU2 domain-containing protein n=1 Tax=unclassified Rhizobium TaxID=2613769 RepID=UPI001CC39669|nr:MULTISPECIES: hypothetical protein [unclassified Rhizobium]MBZ5762407.1 hypothetical protein [Rhizobium sp. VS19-DR96]MBZ5768442.1 hypothetical protein [Rhizobium sp. VS19-DR129.2]MBZ5776096.1 hypothetical protein [Rhizobium sp. VS19-DRK62.2]MBZ5786213.1 hypothetical protein [Rhizobium sp. VS19-DR121]MBZ5804485.1 hypothetical protein [Rhizobium sp. VS19-DR181]
MAKPVTAIDDWNALREVAALGYQDAVLSMAMVATVERSNSPACVGAINDAKADLATRLVVDALLFRLHIFVTRAFGRVSYKDDRHLRAAIEFLKRQPSLDGLKSPEDPVRVQRAISNFDATAVDGRLERLKKMRDKQLAHMASYTEKDRPTINDLFRLAKATADIWEDLAIGSATIFVEVDLQLSAYRKSADRFWCRWDGVRSFSDDDYEDPSYPASTV